MLAILTTHPIQYQAPLWQALARDGRVPFEVWFCTDHGVQPSHDPQFGRSFAWDVDLLDGYPHRFLDAASGATPGSFWKCRLREPVRERMRRAGITALWTQGWQVAAYWQGVREAKSVGVEVWLRGESNDLAPPAPWWKRAAKRRLLGRLFSQVDRFLTIGSANRRLYRQYGMPESRMTAAPYCVDNDRFVQQAAELRPRRAELRRAWNIPEDAFCVLFCGKFIGKKRPLDLVAAAQRLIDGGQLANLHLLLVGAGELGDRLRQSCRVVFDRERGAATAHAGASGPPASLTGFLNQSEISQAYVAADCLVLPSDHGETWGLVVNEALASGLPCAASTSCGCCEDLIRPLDERLAFRCGDIAGLATAILRLRHHPPDATALQERVDAHAIDRTVEAVAELWSARSVQPGAAAAVD